MNMEIDPGGSNNKRTVNEAELYESIQDLSDGEIQELIGFTNKLRAKSPDVADNDKYIPVYRSKQKAGTSESQSNLKIFQ